MDKKIDILKQILLISTGEYYEINLSKNLVPDIMYQVIDEKKYNINEMLGLSANARFSDVIARWGELAPEEERSGFFRFFDRDNLLDNYRRGQEHLCYHYRTTNVLSKPMAAEQHIFMYQDEESGDIMAFTYVLDQTEKLREEENREALAMQLEKIAEQLNTERKYLDVLYRKYILAYHLEVTDSKAKVLSLNPSSHVWKLPGMWQGAIFDYDEHIKSFSEHFITEGKQRFQEMLSREYIADRMKTTTRFSFRMECIPNVNGNCNYEVQVLRTNPDVFDGKVIVLSEEIDDVVLSEKKYQAEVEAANEANKAKTEFVSKVAHDIRTPMNSLFGFLQIAEANLHDAEKVKYCLKKIHVAGDFLKELVNDVLDISKMENQKMTLKNKELRVTELFEELPSSMQGSDFGKNIAFHYEIHDIICDRVIGDSLRLKQIYTNILSNAVKYTPNGGDVSFEVYEEAAEQEENVRLIVTVSDNGIGMSQEFMKKMFAKFERETDTRLNTVSGYGLGLTIVKQLVELMNGEIDVKSNIGQGTVFTVKLELPRADLQQNGTKTKKNYQEICEGMYLLVAEDNELSREVMKELLTMNGIACDMVCDGKECVDAFRADGKKYDAVLMDMQMPNLNGIAATKAIRNLNTPEAQNIPIIAMTANALNTDVQACIAAGMNQHLSKPIDVRKLLKALAKPRRPQKTLL